MRILECVWLFLQPFFGFVKAAEDMADEDRVVPPPLLIFVNKVIERHWAAPPPVSTESAPQPPDTRSLSEISIPSEEIAADEEIVFPVNI